MEVVPILHELGRQTGDRMNELDWIKAQACYLRIERIERELGLPTATLTKYAKGERNLPKKWHQAVIHWVQRHGFPIQQN